MIVISNTVYRTDEKIKTSTKWFFALGDIFSGGFFNIVNFYYAFFLTSVVRISPYWAGLVFLIGNVLDAVTDPGMGIITDNTRTKFGRRRPYIILGAPLVFFAFVMMWFPLPGGTEISKVVFYIFAFVLMNTVTTIVQVPFLSWAAELSTDYTERTAITNVRMVVSVTSSILSAVFPMVIVGMYQEVRIGYLMMGIFFGLFYTLPLILVFLKVKERKQFSGIKKGTWRDMFRPMRLRVFRRYMIMYLGVVLSMDVVAMIFMYFMTYNLQRVGEIQFVLGTLLVSQVATVPLASWFAKKTSKTKAVIVGNIGWTVCAAATFLVVAGSPGFYVYLMACFIGSSVAFSLVGYNSIYGDVTEVGEYHMGYRAEGSFYGLEQFIRKCCAALANWLALFLLGIAGYVAPLDVIENGVATSVEQPQTKVVLFTIRVILGIVPVILLLPSTITAMRWKLPKEKHAKLIGYLDRKRAGLEIDEDMEREIYEICKPLI